jgi:outer membrane lipoprotein LolB
MRRAALWWALTVTLGACAHAPVAERAASGPSFENLRAELAGSESWQMRGRLAVDTGEQAFQGSFQWQQRADALSLSIRGPLGAGVVRVSGPPDRLVVNARGETWELDDPEADLSALLGWWLPVSSLPAWLVGLPDPLYESRETFGADGLLHELEQRLWRLTYDSYQVAEGLPLPRRIGLRHAGLEVRLTVDSWRRGALN